MFHAQHGIKIPSGIKNSHKIGKIDKLCVPVDDLMVISNGRLFVYSANHHGALGNSGRSTKVLTEVIIKNQPNGSRMVDLYHSYYASYVVFESIFKSMELMKVLNCGGFCDAVIVNSSKI